MLGLISRYRMGTAVLSECLAPALSSSECRCFRTTAHQSKIVNKSLLPSSSSRKIKNMAFVKKWNAESSLLYGPKLKISKKVLQKRAAESNISIDMATCNDAIADTEYGLIPKAPSTMLSKDEPVPTNLEADAVEETPKPKTQKRKKSATSKTKRATPLTPVADFPQLDGVLRFPLFPPGADLAGQGVTELGALDALMPQRVTRILERTRSAQSQFVLDRWIQQQISLLGQEGFEKAQQKRLRVASGLHGCVEQFLHGTPEHLLNVDDLIMPFWDSVQGPLGGVEDVLGVEVKMEHARLRYTGTADCVAKYRGELCVIDWKTSGKPRASVSALFDYPLQVAAYLGALHCNRLGPVSDTDRQVMSLLIVVAYQDGSPAHAHYIPRRQVLGFWAEWTKRLHQYWATQLSQQS